MSILDYLVEPFTLPFMTRAMVVTVIAAVVCALLSCWLVMLGWSLMGDAISHAVLPGVVLAYIAGIPFAVGGGDCRARCRHPDRRGTAQRARA